MRDSMCSIIKKSVLRSCVVFPIFLCLFFVTNAFSIRTSTNTTSANWNDSGGLAWENGVVPTAANSVEVGSGFTLYIDSFTECKCESISLQSGAKIIFRPDGVNGSTLTVNGAITMNAQSQILMNTLATNNIFKLSCAGLGLSSNYDLFCASITHAGAIYNISILGDIVWNENSNADFIIDASKASTINLTCQDIQMYDDVGNDFKLYAKNSDVDITINASGYQITVPKNATFDTHIYNGNSKITLNFSYLQNTGNTYFKNDVLSSTMTVNVSGGWIKNYGTLDIWGADPATGNTNKPDLDSVRRSVTFSGTSWSYMRMLDGSNTELKNAVFTGFGYDTTDNYGILVEEVTGTTSGEAFNVYNCVAKNGYVGFYLKNCSELNHQWYDQGISSCVMYGNSFAGVVLSGTNKSEIYHCYISTNSGGNIGDGVYLNNSDMNTISRCDIYGNKIHGVVMMYSDKNLLDSNTIHDQSSSSGEEGVYLYSADKNVIIKNYCYNNPVHGIALEYDSDNNYLSQNHSFNNINGGMRVRYEANDNMFIVNYSTNNGRTGFTSHKSSETLCVQETYSGHLWGDIYLEGEINQGYKSQIWMKGCLLQSTTEFANTLEKQEFTHAESWVISQKHDNTPGLTNIWGNFALPQERHAWHTPVLKWNYTDNTYDKYAYGWNNAFDDPYSTNARRYDASGGHVLSSINTSTTTKSEVWLLTYDSSLNRWQVRGTVSGYQTNWLIPDTDYTSDQGEIRMRITHQGDGPNPCEDYVFVTVAGSTDTNVQKQVKFSDFSEQEYIGANFTNGTGSTMEIAGTSSYPTVITRKLSEDNADNSFYYGLALGGTINKIQFTTFTYVNNNGLRLNSAPLINTATIWITALEPGTTATYIAANGITHTFDNVYIDTTSVTGGVNVRATNSTLYFRDYTRPFLQDVASNSTVTWDPTLVFSGQTGFTADGVEADTINTLGSVELQVKYTDLNNNPPTTVQVWIDLDDNLTFATTEQFGMALKSGVGNDGIYSNGEIYNKIVSNIAYPSLGTSGGKVKYRFFASNPNSVTYSTYTYTLTSVYNNVISTNEATGVATSTKAFTVNGTAPRITITSPSTEQSGLVTISYKLIDDDNKPAPYNYCSITVEYRDGTTWTPATRFIGSELTTSLEASVSPGTAHTFIWDSSTDLPSRNTSTIIRITPTDEDATGTAAATASFWVDNIVATKLAFTSDEQNLEAGTTSQIVYVEAQDSGSNKDTDFNGVINLNTTSSNYTLVNSTANVVLPQILMTTGRAEFKYCDNSPGSPTITVSSTGYSSASQSWTISNPVSNTNSIVSVDGGSSFVAGSTVSIVVTVKDTNSNPVQGKTVALSATGSINSLTQPIDTSNAEGKVYASLYSTKAEDKTITALISDTNLVLVSSATITYSPGTVSTSSSTVQISTSVAATGSTVTVTATLYDAYLNVVPNKTFSVTVSPLRATDIVTSTQTTNNSGVAYAYVYSLTAEDKNVSITVNPPTGYVTLNQTKTIAFRSLDLNVPSVTSVSPENNSTLASAFSNMILVVNDTGGSGVNLSSCTFKFFYMGPYFEQYSGTAWSNYWSSITISGVTSYSPQSGGNTVTFTYAFTEQTVNGTYRIECTPYDNSNNVGSMFTADVLLNIRTEASIIRTVTGSSSGQWNNASTWDPPQVPSSNENVEVGDNFTLIIDTVSTCSAKGMTLKSGAVVMFSTITSNTAALSLSEDITMETNSRFYIVTSTLIANDFNVSVRDILLADDSAGVTINLLGNNSDISVSARDIVFTDNKGCAFSVLGSTNGTVNVTTRNITVGSNNGYNVMVSSGMNVNISATGTGAYGKVSLANGAELYSRIYGENSAVTLNIENLDVADGGDTHFQNDVLTSSMVVVVDRMKCNNGGRMYFIGTNPSGSAVKPDASTIRRNIKLMANQSTGGYVFVQGDRAGIELFNTEVYGMGRLPRSDDTETSSEMYGVTIKDDADYFVYNSNIWFGCTGIKLDTIAMQGATRVGWYNLPTASQFTYGISSSVIHNNSSYGIWYNNVSRNEVYNCIISSTIDNGQLLRLETRTIGIGAYLESSQMNTLKNCDIYNNRVQGVFVYGCDKNLFENNYIHHQAAATGEEGLYLYNSDKNVLVNNYCYNNPVHGIALEYNSENNYLTQNHCYNNRNGGFRIRYNANNNKFITNYSTNNAYIDALNPSGAGFASHSSVDTLLVEETYSNNWLGDIYLEGESNQGYISQIWLKNCLLNSATEFTNTPQKQEFTHPDSWVISQKHEGTAGLTRIWGNFTYPQSSHLWHMPSIKWNNNNQTYSRFYHGWDTTINTYDTPGKRVDANGGSRITSITLSTSTKSEIWIVTYDATLNRWKVKGSSSGVQAVYLIPDTDYTTVGQEVGLRISHSAGTPRDGEEYVFATVADSKDGDEYGGIQKTVQLCDFSESNYAGAKFTNLPGGTVEIIGVSTGP
ncbi:MAG: right-handed parallel beta-helix repeat-containing protein, partial [Elusimicrobiota bacterium]